MNDVASEPQTDPRRLSEELAQSAVRLINTDAATAALVQDSALDLAVASILRTLGRRLLLTSGPDRFNQRIDIPNAQRIEAPASRSRDSND